MESEPAGEQLPWAQCMAYEFEEEASVPAGAAGAPVYQSRRWKKNKIKVHFMNAVPSTWLLTEVPEKVLLTEEKVLEWANGWSNQVPCLKGSSARIRHGGRYRRERRPHRVHGLVCKYGMQPPNCLRSRDM